jgi:hypothetical protein
MPVADKKLHKISANIAQHLRFRKKTSFSPQKKRAAIPVRSFLP